MAAAAIVAVRNRGNHFDNSERRLIALENRDNFWKDLEEQVHFRDLMVSFDTDKSGDLDCSELRRLIQNYGKGIYVDPNGVQLDIMHTGAGRHIPSSPTDEEISWILAATAKVKKNRIVASELKFALETWNSYESNRPYIEAVFRKFDKDHSLMLEHDELKAFLTELNGGRAPKDHEVATIMTEAAAEGGLSKVQLMLASSLWFTHMEELSKHSCCAIA